MSKEVQALTLVDPKGTLSVDGSPLALGEDIRGGFIACSTAYRDTIDGRRLEQGQILWNTTEDEFQTFTPVSGNVRSSTTGAYNNSPADWVEFQTGGGSIGITQQQVQALINAALHVPAGGTEDQVLTKGAGDTFSWEDDIGVLTQTRITNGQDLNSFAADEIGLYLVDGGGVVSSTPGGRAGALWVLPLSATKAVQIFYEWDDDAPHTYTRRGVGASWTSWSTDLITVATDPTIEGDGTASSVLRVANPFTAAEKTKLAGIEDNATADQDLSGLATDSELSVLGTRVSTLENAPAATPYTGGDGIDINGTVISGEQANTNNRGVVQLANIPTTQGGTSNSTAVTPAGLKAVTDSLGTGGIATVNTDATITGDGDTDPLSVANPFTQSDEDKLDGVESGAQRNVGQEYTQTEKTKLGTVDAGAEVNVNADWNAASGDAQILNKPDDQLIPAGGTDNQVITKNPTGFGWEDPQGGSGGGTTYTPGEGIDIENDVISIENATTTNRGGVELATGTETQTGTSNAKVVTPAGMKSATDLIRQVPSGGSPAQVLTRDSTTGTFWGDGSGGTGGGGGFYTEDLFQADIDVTDHANWVGTGLVVAEADRTGWWLVNFGGTSRNPVTLLTSNKSGSWFWVDAESLFNLNSSTAGIPIQSTSYFFFPDSIGNGLDAYLGVTSTGEVLFSSQLSSQDALPLTIRKVVNSGEVVTVVDGISTQVYNLYITNDTGEEARAGNYPTSAITNYFPGFMNFTDDATGGTPNPIGSSNAATLLLDANGDHVFENIEDVTSSEGIVLPSSVPVHIRASGVLHITNVVGTAARQARILRQVFLTIDGTEIEVSRESAAFERVRELTSGAANLPLGELSYDFVPQEDLVYTGSRVRYELQIRSDDPANQPQINGSQLSYYIDADTKEVVTQLNPEVLGGGGSGGLSTVATKPSITGDGSIDDPLDVSRDYHNADVTEDTPRDLSIYSDGAVIFNREGEVVTKDAWFIDVRNEIARSDPEFKIIGTSTFQNTFIGPDAVTGYGMFIPTHGQTPTGGTLITDPFPEQFQRFFYYEEQGQGRVMVFTNIASDNDLRANRLVLTVNDVVLGEWGVSRHNEPINGWNIFDTFLQHNLADAVNGQDRVKIELHENHNYMFQAAVTTRSLRSLKEVVRHTLQSLEGTPETYGEHNQALIVNQDEDGAEWGDIQGDWNESDTTSTSYIHNKPHIVREDVAAAIHTDIGTYTTSPLTNNNISITIKQTPTEPIADMDDDDHLYFLCEADADESTDDSTRGTVQIRVGDIKVAAEGQTILGSGSSENYKRFGVVLSEEDGGAFRFLIVPGRASTNVNDPIEFWYAASPATSGNLPVTVTIKKLPFSLIGAALENRQHIYDLLPVADTPVVLTQNDRFVETDIYLTENDWWQMNFGRPSSSANTVPQGTWHKMRTATIHSIPHTSATGTAVSATNSVYVEHNGTDYYFGKAESNNLTVATQHEDGPRSLHNLTIVKEITATALRGPSGEGIEVIYYQVITGETVPDPNNSWGFGEPEAGWLSEFPGISEARPLVIRAQRVRVDGDWEDWSAGLEFAIWTRDGTDGRNAVDGLPGPRGDQGITGNGDFAALAVNQLGSENVVAPQGNRFVATGITLPGTSEWILINFGADDVGTQILANNYWVRAASILGLDVRFAGDNVAGSTAAVEIEGSNPQGRRAYIGRTSLNELLLGFSPAQGGLSSLPFTVYEVEVADAYSEGTGIEITADRQIISRVVGSNGVETSWDAFAKRTQISGISATESQKGVIELSTEAEAFGGSSNTVPSSSRVRSIIARDVPDATTATKGRIEIATATEANSGSNLTKAMTPGTTNSLIQTAIGDVDTRIGQANIQDLANVTTPETNKVLVGTSGGNTAWETPTQVEIPHATVSQRGAIEIATGTEVTEGLDTERAVTSQGLNARLNVRGIPVGGSHGQLLAKNGGNNYSTRTGLMAASNKYQ